MSTADAADIQFESAIAKLCSGPLEEFVRRRDALAKELRAAGRRDAASIVKNVRKPTRVAWALDLAAVGVQDAVDTLAATVADTLAAQQSGHDVRGATARLHATVRDFANQAARAAQEAGQPVESGVLANAVLAILGDAESFSQLRRGCLVDIPEAGGLDVLAALSASSEQIARTATPKPRKQDPASSPSKHQDEVESSAREAVRQAGVALADARQRTEVSQRALREAEAKLQSAEMRLRAAEEEVRTARKQRDRAQEDADSASARLLSAENAARSRPADHLGRK